MCAWQGLDFHRGNFSLFRGLVDRVPWDETLKGKVGNSERPQRCEVVQGGNQKGQSPAIT